MTAPTGSSTPWTWERILTEILGAPDSSTWDRTKVTQNPWFAYDTAWEDNNNFFHTPDPSNYWEPKSVAHPDWTKLTLGRLVSYNAHYGEWDFRTVQGLIAFYDPSGGSTAKADWESFSYNSSLVVDGMTDDGNETLSAADFRNASVLLQAAITFMHTRETDIDGEIEQLYGDYSGLKGNAADAFVMRLHALRGDMADVEHDLGTPTPHAAGVTADTRTSSIPELLGTVIPAMIKKLRHWVQWAWHDRAVDMNPDTLIKGVINSIWSQNMANLQIQKTSHQPMPSPFNYTLVDDQAKTLAGGPFDLETAAGWNSLDAAVKARWKERLKSVEDGSGSSPPGVGGIARQLEQLFGATTNRLRGVITAYHDPDSGGTGNDDGTGDDNGSSDDSLDDLLNGLGDGGGGDSGLDDALSGLGDGGGGDSAGGGGDGGLSDLLSGVGDGSGGGDGGLNDALSGLDSAGGGDGGLSDLLSGAGADSTGTGAGSTGTGASSLNDMLSGLDSGSSSAGSGTGSAFDPTTGLGSDSLSGLGAATSLMPTGSLSGLSGGSGSKSSGGAALDDMLDGLEPASAQFPTALGDAALGGASEYSGLPIGNLDSASGLAPSAGYATAGGPFGDAVASSALPTGTSAGSAGSSSAGSGSAGTAGSAGMGSGMPMSPGMGGMGGGANGNKESDRERTTWLAEDDEVWGTDPDCAPAVVGREAVQPGRPGNSQPAPRTGGSPYGPARTGTQRPGRA